MDNITNIKNDLTSNVEPTYVIQYIRIGFLNAYLSLKKTSRNQFSNKKAEKKWYQLCGFISLVLVITST